MVYKEHKRLLFGFFVRESYDDHDLASLKVFMNFKLFVIPTCISIIQRDPVCAGSPGLGFHSAFVASW
jgi:hypothetical protein